MLEASDHAFPVSNMVCHFAVVIVVLIQAPHASNMAILGIYLQLFLGVDRPELPFHFAFATNSTPDLK